MDDPAADQELLRRSLAYLRRVNRLLGYTRSTLGHLRRFSAQWPANQTMTILDIATGAGDVPRAITQWAQRHRRKVRVVGIDLHAATARSAAAGSGGEAPLRIVRGDALLLPFADGSFDYAVSSLFLHHLDDEQIVQALSEMSRVARRGVVVGDLLRHRRAYAWINLLSAFANPMVRHDGRVSVMQALSRQEILAMRDRAGVQYANYHHHFGHRFVLAGEKG